MLRYLASTIALVTACTWVDDPPVVGDPPVTIGVREIDLGSVTSDVPMTFSVPENTIGLHIVVEVDGSNGTEQIGIADVIAPSGEAVVDEFYPVGALLPAASEKGIAVVSIPFTSLTASKPVEPGIWTIEVNNPSGKPAHAKAFIRTTADGAFHGGKVDMRVYIPDGLMISDPTPAHAISADTAATDPAVAARIDSFFSTLHQLFELDRGTIEFVSLPTAFREIKDVDARDQALMMTSTPGTDPVVHVVWVNELLLFNQPAWGVSSGIPGTAATAGHAMSGILVDVSLGFPAAADGMTMVHELGHFMGLFHTTEQDRSYHDPIDDTPACMAGVSPCPDSNNIMYNVFYGATRGIGLVTSEQQRRVVWGSPLYRD